MKKEVEAYENSETDELHLYTPPLILILSEALSPMY